MDQNAAGDDGKGVPGSRQISALHRSGSINRGLQSPFALIRHDLSLPEPVRNDAGPETAGIW
jgi:hypothetical protein